MYENALASICAYLTFVLLNEAYYVKFAYGAAGAFFAYAALAYSLDGIEDTDKINSRLSYVLSVASAISVSCDDAAGAVVQMLCVALYDAV